MYHVSIKIPVEFDMAFYAESKEKAIEAFWEKLNDVSDAEGWLMEHANFDLDGVDWEKTVPHISGQTQWYIRDDRDGEPVYFDTEAEAEVAAEKQDKESKSSFLTCVEQVFVAYDEQGRHVDSLSSEDDYDD
jgi:hypothetical protein